MTAPHTPLTLIVEGKPLVFDVPVPVGEVIPAGTWYAWESQHGNRGIDLAPCDIKALKAWTYFTARPPVAPESFADGDVAWVRFDRAADRDWYDPHSNGVNEFAIRNWLAEGLAIHTPSPRPESLADVLDELGLTDEQRARVEKAVGA